MRFLPTRTDDEHARISADYLPNGWPFKAKRITTSVLYKFLKGVSKEFGRLEEKYSEIAAGWILTESTGMLEVWEKTLGIPDGSLPAVGSAESRRQQAHMKLASEGIQTTTEYEWLLSLLGLVCTVTPGYYFWLNPDPRVPPFATEKEARFTIVIDTNFTTSDSDSLPDSFPVSFPWVFGSSNYNVVQKFFKTIIPANCQLIWITNQDAPTGFGYFPFGLSAFGL